MRYIDDRGIDRITGETGAILAGEEKVRIVIEALPLGADIPWEGGLNGHFFRIRRGIEVEVPRSLALLIQQSANVNELGAQLVSEYRGGKGKRLCP